MWGSVVKGTSPHVFCKFAFMEKIHRFNVDISAIELPAQFTYPFNYVPHELARIASAQVREYISSVKTLHDELVHGKMVGVLVVVDASDRLVTKIWDEQHFFSRDMQREVLEFFQRWLDVKE